MAKKSRKRAAKYSELSKSRRKRQVVRPALQPEGVATPKTEEVAATITKKTPAPQRVTKTQPGTRLTISDYGYVRDDLKRIGILTGAIIVILIILAFVLG
jgi:hypothetical protein